MTARYHWKTLTFVSNKNFNKMKIAIPARDGRVDDHFGHCAYFEVVEINEQKQIVASESVASPEGCGCKSNIAGTLSDMGVRLMLAGNMGQGAVMKLMQHGIQVVRGCSGEIKEVVAQYLAGNLVDNEQVCAHHECGH